MKSPWHISGQRLTKIVSLFFLVIVLAACGTATVSPTEPSLTTTMTPAIPALPAGFALFHGNGFVLAYPSDWTHHYVGNFDEFVRSDNVVLFRVSLQGTQQTPCADEPICNKGDVDGHTHQPSVTLHGLTWQQSAWWYYLSNEYYIIHQLTTRDPKTQQTVTIDYSDYSQVASSKLIDFDQAEKLYFQPILQTFLLQ